MCCRLDDSAAITKRGAMDKCADNGELSRLVEICRMGELFAGAKRGKLNIDVGKRIGPDELCSGDPNGDE
jgi:hypothetical protein